MWHPVHDGEDVLTAVLPTSQVLNNVLAEVLRKAREAHDQAAVGIIEDATYLSLQDEHE